MRILAPLLVALLTCSFVGVPASAEEEPAKAKQKAPRKGPSVSALIWAREAVAKRLELGEKAAEFAGDRDWLNVSRPLTLREDLRGKVVILDFWCYCCINCIHVLPDLEYLEERYKDKPFAVVGVHSAKFTNEKDAAQIRQAVLRNEIHHPVVNDADFKIWRSYGASSWPTFAVIAPDGTFIGTLSGEGHREELDALTQALLEHFEQAAPKTLRTEPLPLRLERDSKPPGMLAYPGKVLADAKRGSLFVADSGHNRIVELDLGGTFKRAFGSGERGLVDGPAAKARFFRPQGMALHGGKLWVCDTENHAIRTIDLETGDVQTAAGTGTKGNHWRLVRPRSDKPQHGPWPGKTTALNSPWAILFLDGVGHIAMAGSHSMWSIDPKTNELRHTAGDLSERRLDDADPYKAAFAQPSGIATNGKDLFIADSESSAILRMTPGGAVTTLAGAERDAPTNLFHYGDEDGKGFGKRFQHPLGVHVHAGLIWVADAYNHKLKTLDPATGQVTSRVGSGVAGHGDAPKPIRFAEPSGLSYAAGQLYVADTNNHAIRTVDLTPDGTLGLASTLRVRGVPIPMVHARGGTGTDWPVLIGARLGAPTRASVPAGKPLEVLLDIELPEGWKFTEGAPSVARLLIPKPPEFTSTSPKDVKILGSRTKLSIPAFEQPGTRTVPLRLLYYVCREGGDCRMQAVDLSLQLRVGLDQSTSPRIELRHAFQAGAK